MSRRLRFNDEEGGMAKAQLLKIENYAGKLNDMIHPDDELESWVQAKLAVVAATMGDIKHYLDYELKQMGAGGIASDNATPYEIEFTWDKKSHNDFDSRKVTVYAENADDAKAKVTAKFSNYYSGFRIVDAKQDEDAITGEMDGERRAGQDFKQGGFTADTPYKNEGSTWYEDLREAEELIGSEKWKKMSRDNRVQTAQYLKAKGLIGFYGEEEDVETFAASQYAKGGRIKVGTFDENQLRRGEDKIATEKARKESGLTYTDTKMIKKGGKMYMEVYLIPNQEYYNSSKI